MLDSDPLWYKDAVVYELHVRSFYDSVSDGVGNFRGLLQKLDYLHDLGITAIWLLPFYPSPLKDDGYDIADYTSIHPHYGKLRDFEEFLQAAHAHGIRVITELVLNHTSDEHPWFQRARRAPLGTPERDFYVFSDTPNKYQEARIIFKDFEHSNWAWDPVARAYFWHRFYAHQPDLNYDNPAVWDAIFPVVDFWLERGVDGMRLDAVPYLYEREGTNCENLPETHAFLKALRQHVERRFANRMLLSEANQWPEDAVAYFGAGDESHMAFHFPLMPRMFMAIHMEDRYPIIDIMAQTPVIPESCQWGLFLRNHDELTLEMVTDEERDYMYRAYAGDRTARINLGIRRRLAPLLGNNRRRIELMNGLLFSLPGTPVIYYGDEIGMGDNFHLGDRNGVRTPMQWSSDRNAGFSRANPQKLYLPIIIDPEYHYESVNVEAQQNNPNSLLWWMKRLIALRKRYKAFGRGTLEFLQPANRRILAFLRRYQAETILIVANLSRFVQHVELDLAKLQGQVPVEMFGLNAFPRIEKQLYPLALGPHSFYWFVLEAQPPGTPDQPEQLPAHSLEVVKAPGAWDDILQSPSRERLEGVLASYLRQHRWAGATERSIKSARIRESFPVRYAESLAFVCLVEAEYGEGPSETFVVPLTLVTGDGASQCLETSPRAVMAAYRGDRDGLIVDALGHAPFCAALLDFIVNRRTYVLDRDEIVGTTFPSFEGTATELGDSQPALHWQEQANISVVFGKQLIFKVFRRVEEGSHPEVEIGRYLTEQKNLPSVARTLGVMEYRRRYAEPAVLAVLHGYVANEGTAWQYTLDELSRFYERVVAVPDHERLAPSAPAGLLDLAEQDLPPAIADLIGRYLESARLLGKRTAELHRALTDATDDPAFAPEPFSRHYQRSIYQSMRNLYWHALDQLKEQLPRLPEPMQLRARQFIDSEKRLLARFKSLLERKITAQRSRIHGNYHLGEVLYTGKDFVIIDFEGEPGRSLGDRKVKRSPLRDVASMIRSFHDAAASVLLEDGSQRDRASGLIRPEDRTFLEPWAWTWYAWVASTFLKSYLSQANQAAFLPRTREELHALLEVFLLEKSLHDLGHESKHRPHWLGIPLQALLRLLEESE